MLFGPIETSISAIESLGKIILNGAYKNSKYLSDFYDFVMPTTYKKLKELMSSSCYEQMDLAYGAFRKLEVNSR